MRPSLLSLLTALALLLNMASDSCKDCKDYDVYEYELRTCFRRLSLPTIEPVLRYERLERLWNDDRSMQVVPVPIAQCWHSQCWSVYI